MPFPGVSLGNGNGNGDAHHMTPLAEVTAHLEERSDEDEAVEPASDPLHRWKNPKAEVTLQDLHEGLIAVAQFAEANIENSIKMAADLHKALPYVERNGSAIAAIAPKLESVIALSNTIDQEVADMTRKLDSVARDLGEVKSDVKEVRSMLAQILERLPEQKQSF